MYKDLLSVIPHLRRTFPSFVLHLEKKSFIPTASSMPKRRAKKHPLAPKRPMSAFLKYSKNRRKVLKAEYADMDNTDVSRLLGEMWRNASEEQKRPFKDTELKESK